METGPRRPLFRSSAKTSDSIRGLLHIAAPGAKRLESETHFLRYRRRGGFGGARDRGPTLRRYFTSQKCDTVVIFCVTWRRGPSRGPGITSSMGCKSRYSMKRHVFLTHQNLKSQKMHEQKHNYRKFCKFGRGEITFFWIF